MKQHLLNLFAAEPALANRPAQFLEDLADDVQAVIIRALGTGDATPEAELEQRVDDIFGDVFGASLFNLLTLGDFPGKANLLFSDRLHITKAMLQTMVLENGACFDRQRGEVLRERLTELTIH